MSAVREAIAARLEHLRKLYRQIGGRPLDRWPVFVAARDTALFLGHAMTHTEAEALGAVYGFTFGKVSRAKLPGDEREFWILHQ